jgi:hypothetical protein
MRVAKAILAAGISAGVAVGLSVGLSTGCTAPLEGLRCPCANGYECDAFLDRCFLLSDGGISDASDYPDARGPDGAVSPIDADPRTPDASGPVPDAGPDDSDAGLDPDGGADSGPPDAG